ncbi:hypothetical protein I3760_06G084200 [Carya illinoinensis]|nr:hypothetical protein I3760_06G084200 [Carya illinoinensis]KAG2702338.1 hypothetical protein I3760_06G084200 [Carya illinoinensis]KAG2702339.1 hypothetical protein I3760_06G084200 [Carya illinoinensis]
MMAFYRHSSDMLTERRGILGMIFKSLDQSEHGFRVVRRGRRLCRITRQRLSRWVFVLALLFLIYFVVSGVQMLFHDSPCEVGLVKSVDDLVEPKDLMKFTQFSLEYIEKEEILPDNYFEPRFGGHQTLPEREKSFYARNQTLHCGFVNGPPGYSSIGFDLNEKDKAYMYTCKVVVSSCIFGSSDFLRRPTRRLISEYSKKNVCFVMFVDEQTLLKLSLEGNTPDDDGYVGLWKIIVVRNLPYKDMRKTGKVPKFLPHRLFPSSRYSIWLDSKMRLQSDPMLIIEYFLWRTKSEYAISNHYDRHCVWEELFLKVPL